MYWVGRPSKRDLADNLLTEDGLTEELAALYQRLRGKGLKRDEISAMTQQKHVLSEFRAIQEMRLTDRTVELEREVAELKRLLEEQSSGSTLSYSEQQEVPLPRLEETSKH